MKIAYFDLFCGASGDMIIGALLDAGLSLQCLGAELKKLKLSGYRLKKERVKRGAIAATSFSVEVLKDGRARNLRDILDIIERSSLAQDVKKLSQGAFQELARAEAKIHRENINRLHFHELGAIDTIIDIVGAFAGIKTLGIERIYASRVHLGTGFVKCAHGVLPIPAPATLALLKNIPVYSQGIEAELTTPTGACILKSAVHQFGAMPEMKIKNIGYGAGRRKLPIPNCLRICLGEARLESCETDEVMLLEANIDDMLPEMFEYVSERLFTRGALDVFLTPLVMKKSRPAVTLSVLCPPEKLDDTIATIFDATTTFGVRLQRLQRKKLLRQALTVDTQWGKVTVKVGRWGDQVKTVAPEYESCKKIALSKDITLQKVYDMAKNMAVKTLSKKGGLK